MTFDSESLVHIQQVRNFQFLGSQARGSLTRHTMCQGRYIYVRYWDWFLCLSKVAFYHVTSSTRKEEWNSGLWLA